MKNNFSFIFAFVLVVYGQMALASSLVITKSQVNFLALATPGALKISGKQSEPESLKTELKVENNQVSGTSTLKLDSLTTGISLRDKHMKDNYLEVSKFPESQFTYKKLSLPSQLQGEKIPFEGTLKLHGIEKPISGTVKINKQDSGLRLEHEFKIKTGEFGISTPKYMSVTMGDEVVVQVLVEGNLK